jgi:thiamine biosynthesis lipoprotein ApbE
MPSQAEHFTLIPRLRPKPQTASTTRTRPRTLNRRPLPARCALQRRLQEPFPNPRSNRGPPNSPHLSRHQPRFTNRRPPTSQLPSSQEGPDTRPRSSTDNELASVTWEALGTSVVLRLTDSAALANTRAQVERELDAIDRACSRFRADSELSRVNASAGRPVQIGELLMDALELALRAAELTGGDVDPTVGRALELAGYDRDWRLLTHREDHAEDDPPRSGASIDRTPRPDTITVRRLSGWRTVTLDRGRACVQVPRGVRLDLGATAKGWAADRAAHVATQASGCGVLVSIGGDIATSGAGPAGGWRIHVTDDHRSQPTAPGQTITILSGGLATSSTTVRRWRHEGRTMHHIIDPRTGAPARTCWRTVSVAAASCAEANIAATAALVNGTAAAGWLAERGLPARLVDHYGRILYVGDWPQYRGGAR